MSKMTLDNLVSGKIHRPLRVVLYGVEGIGKTTWAADAPSPIFIGAEDGSANLEVDRFHTPDTYHDILDAIKTLYHEEHGFKTVVVDSIDWVESLIFSAVAVDHNVTSIEGIGHGKGYVYAVEKFAQMLRGFDALVSKGMNIIIVGHALVKTFNDPEFEPYDRYSLKLSKQDQPKLIEWCDALLFANYDTSIVNVGTDKNPNVRAKSFNKRLLYTERRAAFDAKNRFSLPDRLPLSWDAFWQAYLKATGRELKVA
ncbi:ATP-binding protein [Gammaproteobacteria bacterium]